MDKSTKIILVILAIALIALGTYIVLTKTDNIENNTLDTNKSVNQTINNAINWINTEINKNEIENKLSNSEPENEIKNETIVEEPNNEPEEVSDDQKALDIVKNEWGQDDNVNFKIDEKTEDGKYSISVVDKNTTEVIMWYEVDTKNNTIQEK